jgi:hypothetical protein
MLVSTVPASAESKVKGTVSNSDVQILESANSAVAVMGNANANMGSVRVKDGSDIEGSIYNRAEIDGAENTVRVAGSGNIDSVVFK